MSKKTTILLAAICVAACTVLIYVLFFQKSLDPRTTGLTKVEGYKHISQGQIACAALLPECGLCYGQVIDNECYVDKTKLTPAELHEMGF